MEQIRKFLRDKGFALALLACLVAAAAAGVWAVRTVRDELDKNLSGLKTPDSTSTAPGIDEGLSTTTPQEDETTWEWPTEPAANSVSNVPRRPPRHRGVRLRPPLCRRLALARCANHPRCKVHPRLPAVRQRLLPRSRSLAGCSMDTAAMSWSTTRPWATGAPTTASTMPAQRMLPSKAPRGHGGAGRFRWQLGPTVAIKDSAAVSGGSAAWPARR
mgnify:CR=1 FL=1